MTYQLKWEHIVIIMLIILGLFISQCPTPKPEPIITSDTTIIVKSDTVKIYDTLVKTIKVFINKPVPVILPNDSNPSDSVEINQYITEVSDSIIEGHILTNVEGKLREQSLQYKLKIPLLTVIHDSVFTTINTVHTIKDNRLKLLLGAESGGNATSFDFKLIGGIHTKDNWNFFYNYGLLSKTHNIGFMKSIPLGK